MTLTKKDLQSIKSLVDDSIEQNNEILTEKILFQVKDIVEFSIEGSEHRMEAMMDRKIVTIIEKIDREVSDLAENTREVLDKMGNHEVRIKKLELKTGTAVK